MPRWTAPKGGGKLSQAAKRAKPMTSTANRGFKKAAKRPHKP
jgi:hypothetical protein